MTTIKDLEVLLKLLRKHGVQEYHDGDLHLKLGDAPAPKARKEEPDNGKVETDPALTDEQILLWSANG